jgi:hypothetical protein
MSVSDNHPSLDPLEDPAAVYAPFDQAELKRLRNYVDDVDALRQSALFTNPASYKISGTVGEPIMQQLTYPGEDAIHTVVGRFRQIYTATEPTSCTAILKLLGDHVHQLPSPQQQGATDALRAFRALLRDALKDGFVQFNINGEVLTGPKLIDLFLHGHYLHKGNEKSAFLDSIPMRPMMQAQFLAAVSKLIVIYWAVRDVVALILETPSLAR